MGIIDKLRRVGGIVKNRLSSAVGALRGVAAGVTVSGARVRRGVRFAARGARLTTPAGIALTVASFGPEIVRGVRAAGRALPRIITRGVAFFGGRQVVGAAAAGGVSGILTSRKRGGVTRPSDFGDPSLQTRLPTGRVPVVVTRARRPGAFAREAATQPRARRRRKARARPTARRIRVKRRKKRTHRSPRHKGHKRVSFTTASGQKVSFLAAKTPAGRHR